MCRFLQDSSQINNVNHFSSHSNLAISCKSWDADTRWDMHSGFIPVLAQCLKHLAKALACINEKAGQA